MRGKKQHFFSFISISTCWYQTKTLNSLLGTPPKACTIHLTWFECNFKSLYQFGWQLLYPAATRGTDKGPSRDCTCPGLLGSPWSLASDCQQGLNDTIMMWKLKSFTTERLWGTGGARAAWQLRGTGPGHRSLEVRGRCLTGRQEASESVRAVSKS